LTLFFQANSERLLRGFTTTTGGEVFPGDEALELLLELRSRSVKPTTLIRNFLHLGDTEKDHGKNALAIRVWAYAKVMEVKLPSSKKFSKVAADAADVVDEETKGEVSMVRTYKVAEQALEEGDAGETKLVDDVELQKVMKKASELVDAVSLILLGCCRRISSKLIATEKTWCLSVKRTRKL
jgi:hypothetical protein